MISVVIPLYNKEKAIVATLQSVLTQTYTDYEVVIVDDGSTDNSLNVVREYISSLHSLQESVGVRSAFRLIHKENAGVSSARNKGIKEAKGEYIAFLDADDVWDKEYLQEQMRMICDFPYAVMWGINFAEMYKDKVVRRVPIGLPDEFRGYVDNYFQMKGRVSDLFCSSSVVIRKEVFDLVGLFDERIKYAEDSDMWFRIIATHKVAFYDRYMVYYQWDAENRAMQGVRALRYFLPFYVEKFRNPIFKKNAVFYRWINQWSANHIRRYYFEGDINDKTAAAEAVKSLDYSVIPIKYQLFFRWPYSIAKLINKLDKLYHK